MSERISADLVCWEVRLNSVQPGVIGSLEDLHERLAEGWEPFAVTWNGHAFNYHLRRRTDG